MNIKTFRAKTLQEGLEQVREEFGEQARIMHTRDVEQRGFFGLKRDRYVEITASEGPPVEQTVPESVQERPEAETPFSDDAFLERILKEPRSVGDHDTLYAGRRQASPASDASGPVPVGSWRRLLPEQLNPTLLQRNLMIKFNEFARFGGPFNLVPGKQKTVALLGSTGVGKTSTIAKIAAHYKIKEHKRVGLLTMDMFRIAATEQLQRYAEMLELPLEAAADPARIPATLKRLAGCDLVLLDTPGTNPKNVAKLQMLSSALDAAGADETLLVLAATSSQAVLTDSIRRFTPLAPTGLILTKLDETAGLHDLYQTLKDNTIPLRFFTMGQNISEDIEVAGPARLASL